MNSDRIYRDIFGDGNYLDSASMRARGSSSVTSRSLSFNAFGRLYDSPTSPHNSRLGNLAKLDQAMVKIVRNGGVKSLKQLNQQMDYIEKDGDAELTVNNQGIPYSNSDSEFEAEMAEWEKNFQAMGRGAKTYHFVVSFPPHVSPDTAAAIGRDYAEAVTNGALGDHYKTLHAHHTDTKHPHTHIVVNRLGESGRTLRIHPMQDITVDTLRELQVSIAREHGVYMNATRRHTRPNRAANPVSLGRFHAKKAGRELPDQELSPSRAAERYTSDELPMALKALKALQASDEIFGSDRGRPLSGLFEKIMSGADPSQDDKKMLAIMSDDIAEKASHFIKERVEQLNDIKGAAQHQQASQALKRLANVLGPLLSDEDKARWGYKESGGAFIIEESSRDNTIFHERDNKRNLRDDDWAR